MRVNITYTASSGNVYNLVTNGIRHREANYHRWEWGVEGTKLQYGYRVADFSRDPAEYETELIFYGPEVKRRALINALHDDFEADVRNKSMGRITWGDYYLDCYIKESETGATDTPSWTSNVVTIYAPYPFWIQDVHVSLPVSEVVSGAFLDFPYDYPYDYTAPAIGTMHVKSDFPFKSDFKMIIYGQAVNPHVTINGYSYVLYTTIPTGAYAVIDSRNKTITQVASNGAETNLFDYRNKADSIFEKIPSGNLTITWDASFGVDLTIYHERSEPRVEVTT